jgi:DNA-binding XRE family transcriptional regulator
MHHDLLHIQGKPYMLVPLHDYRQLIAGQMKDAGGSDALPDDILDLLAARQAHPVKILRTYRGLTQDKLAQSAGLSRPYLTEIETRKKEGSIAVLKAIAGALDVPVSLLF